jgi:hypothetical protein
LIQASPGSNPGAPANQSGLCDQPVERASGPILSALNSTRDTTTRSCAFKVCRTPHSVWKRMLVRLPYVPLDWISFPVKVVIGEEARCCIAQHASIKRGWTMASAPRVAALSQFDIENKILDYFVGRFRRPPTEITRNTDLKTHFNFNGAGTWESVAPALSAKDWMIALDVELEQSEMTEHVTAKALAQLIWAKVSKLVTLVTPHAFNTFAMALPRAAKPKAGKVASSRARTAKRPSKPKPRPARGGR